ncbi:endopeptidase La [Hydrogenophaga soli]|nr:endopeptidase La [Burkholderiaceae bacterium]
MSGNKSLPPVQVDLPLLPLRDVVVFPHMVIPLFVGRAKSIRALEVAMEAERRIVLVAQKAAAKDEPSPEDLFEMGCVATILQLLKLPDGTVKVLVEGGQRARLNLVADQTSHFSATVTPVDAQGESGDKTRSTEIEALRRALMQQFDQYVKLNKKIPSEILTSIASIDDPGRLADTIAAHLPLKLESKQEVLDIASVTERLTNLFAQLEREVDILTVDKRIRGRVKRQMEKNQRDFYLNEQVKAIQKELGEGEDGADLEEIEKRIKLAKMPAEARKKAEGELKKLKLMSPMSAEATVVRNYIDVLTGLPWAKKTKIKHNLALAEDVLNQDHHGLERVKDRILEYLAVQQRVDKVKAPILCLVGPPGVGKTSLGQSIAKATGRKYVRMALGGVRDEAEIRGHRRTYIGALPGKVLQSLTKVGTRNPLFLLDEIDKMGTDFRGDPSSALLEVLDPEQNHTFGDHYVEVDFDLSDVMFVATSNSMNIPPALLDRMEVIRLSGYTEDEKVSIATKYLLPKQLNNNGLKAEELSVSEAALRDIVRYYTREAGVRSLEREVSKICRKVVKGLLLKTLKPLVKVDADNLSDYLGVRKYTYGRAEEQNQVGQVVGLAWTEVGGDLLTIEAALMPGKGNILRTGSLGDVMKESVEAARTVVRSRARVLGIADELFEKRDIHIHVPDGATPKDGPSAGAAMATALVSALTGIAVKGDVAMTGEITLRGEITAIGGLKEKLLAALRGGIKTVLIPEENVKDLAEIPDNVKSDLNIVAVRWFDKVLEVALERQPVPLTTDDTVVAKAEVKTSDVPAVDVRPH